MTLVRPIVPGRTQFFTRRCTQREFILRPDDEINAALAFCLGRAAAETGVQIHSFLAMSNHVHGTMTDPEGAMPDFARRFDSLAARMINCARGRWENLWVPGDTSYVHCVELCDVIAKTIYTLANPVADHLVDKAIHWPGLSTFAWLDGRTAKAKRPRGFCHPERTVLPDEVQIKLTAPPAWPGSFAEWAATIRAGVELEERKAAEKRTLTGERVLGRKAILAASPTQRPKTPAPRRQMKPRIAAKNPVARRAAIRALKDFRHAYALAREKFLAGKRAVEFPPGTWFMFHRWGVALASSGADFVPS